MKIDFCMIIENVLGVNKTVLHSKFPKHSFQKDLFDYLVFLQCNQLQPLSVRPSCCRNFKLMHQKLQTFWPAVVNRKVSIQLHNEDLILQKSLEDIILKKKHYTVRYQNLSPPCIYLPTGLQQPEPNRKMSFVSL